MPRGNVELHHQVVDATNRRELEAFLALMDENVEAMSRIASVEGGFYGHDGVRTWWANWFESFPDYKVNIIGMRDMGDVTIASIRAVGHGGGSELPYEDNAWLACQWLSGKCTWWQVFPVEGEALEAVELRQSQA